MAGQPSLFHRTNSNPIACDDAESPRKIPLGLDQRQCEPGRILRRFGSHPEQDDTAGRRKATPKNELTQILVEREEHPILAGADQQSPRRRKCLDNSRLLQCVQGGRGKFSSASNFMRS